VPPKVVAADGRDDHRDQDDVAPPPGHRNYGAKAPNQPRDAGCGGEFLDVAGVAHQLDCGFAAVWRFCCGGLVFVGHGEDIQAPPCINQGVKGKGGVAQISGKNVAGFPDGVIVAANGQEGSNTNEDCSRSEQNVHAEAADHFYPQLAEGDVQPRVQIQHDLALLNTQGSLSSQSVSFGAEKA